MNDFKIVPGTDLDIDEISALYDHVAEYAESHVNYPGWKKGVYPTRADAELGIKEGTLYAALINKTIAGSVIVNEKQEEAYDSVSWRIEADPKEVAVIHTFMVHPDYTKYGIGRRLLEFSEEKAIEEGKKVIRLDVYEKNEPAIRLYERMGYEYVGDADLGLGEYGLPLFKLYEKSLSGKDYPHD